MRIIDTHIHVWDLDKAEYDWLKGDTSKLNRTYKIAEIEDARKASNVQYGVFVQSACNLEDTYLMLDIAEKTDWVKGVVGWLPLLEPKETDKLLTTIFNTQPLYKGMRHLIHDEPNSKWLLQSQVLESLQLLASHNLPFDVVGILPEHLECVLAVQEKIPNLKMILDHLNAPPMATKEKFGNWGTLIAEVAKHKNVYIKISGQATASGNFEGRTAEDIIPYVHYALEHFGVDRALVGGDWPVSTLANEYADTWKLTTQVVKSIITNEADLDKIFYSNAIAFYNLSID